MSEALEREVAKRLLAAVTAAEAHEGAPGIAYGGTILSFDDIRAVITELDGAYRDIDRQVRIANIECNRAEELQGKLTATEAKAATEYERGVRDAAEVARDERGRAIVLRDMARDDGDEDGVFVHMASVAVADVIGDAILALIPASTETAAALAIVEGDEG